jgi:hypothetical protein
VKKSKNTAGYQSPLPWFRVYTEFADDPKIQRLAETMQRRFVLIMCLTGKRLIPTDDDAAVSFAMRLSAKETARTKSLLMKAKLIQKDWKPTAWERRQFSSDHGGAERQKRYRDKHRDSNVTVTAASRHGDGPEGEERERKNQKQRREDADSDADSDSDGPETRISGNARTRRTAQRVTDHCPEFAKLRKLYPTIDRKGQPDWHRAELLAQQLVDSGKVSWSELEASVLRYRQFMAAGCNTPDCAYSPGTFFLDEPDALWQQKWSS